MSEFSNYSIMLIGLGPHAKRIYMNLFKKYKIIPKIIVDLKSKQKELEDYIEENDLRDIHFYFIEDEKRDDLELNSKIENDLKNLIKSKNIKYAIISTEPKAHFAYAKFLLENNINILMDKPITAPINVISNQRQALKIKTEYEILSNMYKLKKDKIAFKIQCQRRFHEGYICEKNFRKHYKRI